MQNLNPTGKTHTRARRNSYDWDTWFDGEPHIIQLGVDFTCTIATMRTFIYKKAAQYGLRVEVDCDRALERFTFQAYPKNGNRPVLPTNELFEDLSKNRCTVCEAALSNPMSIFKGQCMTRLEDGTFIYTHTGETYVEED